MRKFKAALWICFFVASIIVGPQTGWSEPLQFGNGNFYELITDELDWFGARDAANARTHMGTNGHLVTITSQEENNFLASSFVFQKVWIGGSDDDAEGTWRWAVGPEANTIFWIGDQNGQAPNGAFANWPSSEPNSSGTENFVELLSGGSWNDQSASDQQGFIVEYEIPEPTTAVIVVMGFVFAGGLASRGASLRST